MASFNGYVYQRVRNMMVEQRILGTHFFANEKVWASQELGDWIRIISCHVGWGPQSRQSVQALSKVSLDKDLEFMNNGWYPNF